MTSPASPLTAGDDQKEIAATMTVDTLAREALPTDSDTPDVSVESVSPESTPVPTRPPIPLLPTRSRRRLRPRRRRQEDQDPRAAPSPSPVPPTANGAPNSSRAPPIWRVTSPSRPPPSPARPRNCTRTSPPRSTRSSKRLAPSRPPRSPPSRPNSKPPARPSPTWTEMRRVPAVSAAAGKALHLCPRSKRQRG